MRQTEASAEVALGTGFNNRYKQRRSHCSRCATPIKAGVGEGGMGEDEEGFWLHSESDLAPCFQEHVRLKMQGVVFPVNDRRIETNPARSAHIFQ